MQQRIGTIKYYLPYAAPVVSFALLMITLNQTNPLEVGPAGILLVFGLTYIFMASTLYILITLILVIVAYFVRVSVRSRRRIYYIASIWALAPVFLVALNSIGQLELKDFVLVISLVGLASFYTLKRS